MEITDVPQQITTALKYSLRSRGSFVFSFLGAVLVCGAAFDVSYGFLYTRIFNARDIHYGHLFWEGLLLVSVVLPITFGLIRIIAARRQERPFPADKYGVAIAPFGVVSLDPDTLGTSSKLRALDELMTQFFTAQQRIIGEDQWSKDFEFRFLPPYAHIHRQPDAERRLHSMRAVLVIWGQIVQQTGSTVQVDMHICGPEIGLAVDIQRLETKIVATYLKFWALLAAAFSEKANGNIEEAVRIFSFSKPLAAEMDQLAGEGSTSNAGMVDHFIQQLTPPQPAPTTEEIPAGNEMRVSK